jgi:5-methylthioadenosine/S-adenosylhomocysteine deaminase
LESLHSGITTTLDFMYAHPKPYLSDAVIKAFNDLKVRGILARGFLTIGEQNGVPKALLQGSETIENDCRRLFDTYHNSQNGRIQIWVAPSAMWSNSREAMQRMWRLTNEYESGFTVHISETLFPRKASKQVHGFTDAEALLDMGIVGPNVLMAHCVYFTEQDIKMTKEYEMKVSHNAVCNMYLASGIAPIPKMLEKDITIGMGLDGAASNNSQDMIETMKTTALLHKVHTLNPTIISAEKVLEMATIDGAKTLGLEDKIGSLEIGKQADLFIFNPGLSAKSIPMHNPVSTLVYSSSGANVETVIIDGQIVLEKGKVVGLDEEKFLIHAQKVANSLAERAGISNRGPDHPWSS